MSTYKEKLEDLQGHEVTVKVKGSQAEKKGPGIIDHIKQWSDQSSLEDV